MYCKHCGQVIPNEKAIACPHCGAAIEQYIEKPVEPSERKERKPGKKTAVGFFLGLFLNLIGLIIGVLMYPASSDERRTFVKGWGISLAIEVVLSVLIVIISLS